MSLQALALVCTSVLNCFCEINWVNHVVHVSFLLTLAFFCSKYGLFADLF